MKKLFALLLVAFVVLGACSASDDSTDAGASSTVVGNADDMVSLDDRNDDADADDADADDPETEGEPDDGFVDESGVDLGGGGDGPDVDREIPSDDRIDELFDTPAFFDVVDDLAYMNGVIGPSTPDAVDRLLNDHPEVTTIVLEFVPGSEDDDANLDAARLVREAGLATHVTSYGEISSGGVDFYLAGLTRTYAIGAQFGVHSWGGGPVAATELPVDDPEHERYLNYYEEMGVDLDFYWFTLEAAPAESMYWMTDDELDRWGFVTR